MNFFLAGLCILITGGLMAWLLRRESVGLIGAIMGPLMALLAPIQAWRHGKALSISMPWNVPYGSFFLEIDALSAFFLAPILAISALGALYGFEYLIPYRNKRNLRSVWFFYNILVASMMIVVTAKNGILFLTAWETMALASFFLVIFEAERPETLNAGWSYLIASHMGTACLLVLFIWLGRLNGTLDFNGFGVAGAREAGFMFLLAVLGFGIKAGFFPLHVWLPEAHPAAPSHVSALMSGVMVKTGIYGLLQVYLLLGPGPAWWGWLLISIGALSGLFGALFALAQHDLKRLLAYSSVENIGIIALGLGLGMLGRTLNDPFLATLGFCGGLLHVLNHGLFKSLLFLSAGAVVHVTGTRDMERLGGLIKRIPWTAALFLLGAMAISGLPPLNGFVSEFLILLGAFRGISSLSPQVVAASATSIASLALIGGLAIACFIRAFGVSFLGEPRAKRAQGAHEVRWPMLFPMVVLAAGCLMVGIGSPWLDRPLTLVVAAISGQQSGQFLADSIPSLLSLTMLGTGFLVLVALLAGFRIWLLHGRPVEEALTWDCGYARPSSRMQYTASSFAQPLMNFFAAITGSTTRFKPLDRFYPVAAEFATATPDIARTRLFDPVFRKVRHALMKLRWIQHGHPQLYVLYIAITLLTLFLWKLG